MVELTEEVPSLADEFCDQCDHGWVWEENNTVSPCSCSLLRQDQQSRYRVDYRHLMRRIGRDENQTFTYRPVAPDRKAQWQAFIEAKKRGEVNADDDDVDAWLARGGAQSAPERPSGSPAPEPPPKAPSAHPAPNGDPLGWRARSVDDEWDEF